MQPMFACMSRLAGNAQMSAPSSSNHVSPEPKCTGHGKLRSTRSFWALPSDACWGSALDLQGVWDGLHMSQEQFPSKGQSFARIFCMDLCIYAEVKVGLCGVMSMGGLNLPFRFMVPLSRMQLMTPLGPPALGFCLRQPGTIHFSPDLSGVLQLDARSSRPSTSGSSLRGLLATGCDT